MLLLEVSPIYDALRSVHETSSLFVLEGYFEGYFERPNLVPCKYLLINENRGGEEDEKDTGGQKEQEEYEGLCGRRKKIML